MNGCIRYGLTKTVRRKMKSRMVLTEGEFIRARDELINQGTYFTAGHSSLYVPSTQTKYLNEKATRNWLDLDGEIVPMTAGEAARTELERAFPTLKRVGWQPKEVVLLDARSPCHYAGQASGEMVYVDLKSAYHQIYSCLWLDTCYPRAIYGQYALKGVAHALKHWKAARNGVLGICRSRYLVGFRGHKRIEMQIKNKFLAPPLWATVQDTLDWIAAEAIERGAIYVNTDGYLFPMTGDFEGFFDYLADHHLRYKIRAQGEGDVRGWNAYKVGSFETMPYKLSLPNSKSGKEFSNVKGNFQEQWASYRKKVYCLVRYS